MKPKRNQRWRLVADVRLQGLLCARVVAYWIACQVAMVGTMLVFSLLLKGTTSDSTGSIWRLLIPAITVSTLILPIMLFDLLTFSNRFAGPLLNFRKKFKQYVETGVVEEMRFRGGDFFPELRDDFNSLRKQSLSRPQHSVSKHREAVTVE